MRSVRRYGFSAAKVGLAEAARANWLQRSLIALVIALVYWNGIFDAVPRADHLAYMHQITQLDSIADILMQSPAWNRTHSAGDYVLYRPLLYLFMGLEYYLFGQQYEWWAFTSVFIHILVCLAIHALLLSAGAPKGRWPFLLSLWFGLSASASEGVFWFHIVGYLLFVLLRILALRAAFEYLRGSRGYQILGFCLCCVLANLLYETGILIDAATAGSLLLAKAGSGWSLLPATWRSKLPAGPRFSHLAIGLLVSAAVPAVANVADLWYRVSSGQLPPNVTERTVNLGQSIYHAAYQIVVWVGTWQLPILARIEADGRASYQGLEFSWAPGSVGNLLLFLALLVATGAMFRLFIRRVRIRGWALAGLGLAWISIYSGVIAVGRTAERGLEYTLGMNLYYGYIANAVVVATIALLVFASAQTRSDEAASRARSTSAVDTAWYWRPQTWLTAALAGITLMNVPVLLKLARDFRYEVAWERAELLAALAKWHSRHGDEANVYYTVPSNCVGDDTIDWFSPHRRRGSSWNGSFTFSSILYPEHSRHLNEQMSDAVPAGTIPLHCVRTKIDQADLIGTWRSHSKGPRRPQITRDDGNLQITDQNGRTAKVVIEGGKIIVPAWQREAELGLLGHHIIWRDGEIWLRRPRRRPGSRRDERSAALRRGGRARAAPRESLSRRI